MTPLLLRTACAGLLLATGASAAAQPEEAIPAPAPEAGAKAATKSSTVTVFVTAHDARGKEIASHSARVEGPDSRDWGVAPEGVKLSMPTGVPPDVLVLIPGAKCKVTLSAVQVAGGSVTIIGERLDSGLRCVAAAGRPAADAPPSASTHGGSGRNEAGQDQPDPNF